MAFLMAQVVGRKFSASIGFDDDDAARQAARIVKQAATARRR